METQVKEKRKRVRKAHYFDYSLLAIVIFLMCFGLVMLYSTSSYSAALKFKGDSMYYFRKQAIISAGSLVAMLIVSQIDYHIYVLFAKLAYWISFILMALVLVPGVGIEAYGAKRWIRLPFGLSMQPAEVTKIAIIIFIPLLICKAGKRIKNWKVTAVILVWGAAASVAVLVLTDNLSSAVIVAGIVCVIVFVAHPKTGPLLAIAGAGVGIIAIAVKFIDANIQTSDDFRIRRILAWLHPEQFMDDGGFQVMQGLYAIGSGGFFGKGLGNSAQKMIIPEAQNDMILSIICEELGVFGVIVMLLLFGMMLYRLMFIAQNAPDLYGSLIVTGIFAHIAIQVVFNIAVVLSLFPPTGVTLPFVSYGGTSILFLMAEMGLALAVSTKIKMDE